MKNIIYLLIFFIWISLFLYNFFYTKNIKQENKHYNEKKININKNSFLEFYKKFDFDSDDSITKFVDKKKSYKNLEYKPKNLTWVEHLFIYTNKEKTQQLRKIAKEALIKLSIEFYKEFNTELKIISAYRSYDEQKKIETSACENNLCAKAWYSEHQSWLAVDLWQAMTKEEFEKNENYKKYFSWMQKNAYKFWFINTYKKWIKIDDYDIEPWHWRYVWTELANFLHKNNMTFREFYYKWKNQEN
jgi:D-alanyl-D-alanine carboxypeptidase